jgi:Ca2+-binding EF-hand superfamily protein
MLKSFALAAALALTPAVVAQDDPPPMPNGGGMPSPEQIFGFLDGNQDGFIGKDEARGPLEQHFDFVDADKDGKISMDELKTAMAAMRPPEPPQGGEKQ